MWRNTQSLMQSASIFCSKRSLSHVPLRKMMGEANQLVIQKNYEAAQAHYEKIMQAYPNYENAYKEYYFLEYKITGPYGLTQSLFEHLQKKYLEAVNKYGEYKEDVPASPKV